MPASQSRGSICSRILFIDDDPFVLEGLRDALRPQRRRWQMTFASSAEEALSQLEHDRPDVVVCDLRMPAMDGATLLEHIHERCPSAVRIVLSGHGEGPMVARAAAIAHRLISKPCDSEELIRVLESACGVHALTIAECLDGRLFSDAGVPSAPQLYAEMTQLLSDGQATIVEAARLVERDMGMAAKILQLANSSYFGRRSPVSDITQAVAYLGLEQLRALILQAEVLQAFRPEPPIPGFDLERVQRHGTAIAHAAKALTDAGPIRDGAFTAGLLEDIGLLVLASHHSEEVAEAIDVATSQGRPLYEVERERYGFTHADVGAHVLALWGLPVGVTDAVAAHHEPANLDLPLNPTAAVRIATVVVESIQGDAGAAGAPGGRFSDAEVANPVLEPLLARARAATGVPPASEVLVDASGLNEPLD